MHLFVRPHLSTLKLNSDAATRTDYNKSFAGGERFANGRAQESLHIDLSLISSAEWRDAGERGK